MSVCFRFKMALRGVDSLLGELEKAKESLKDVDKNIAKLTGRSPNESIPRPGQRRSFGRGVDRMGGEYGGGQGRLFNVARRGLSADDGTAKRRVSDTAFGRRGAVDEGPPAKRRVSGGAFSRLGPRVMSSRLGPRNDANSGDESELSKHTVQSSVVAGIINTKSREEVAESQSKDRESKGRNRRMFGLLMGTLQRFRDDQKVQTDKESKRKVVEERLEMKAKAEQEGVKKERRKLFQDRQKKEQKIKRLEQKMELVKIHDEWASQTQMLGNFIRTKAKPHLYYIPKAHSNATKDRLSRTKDLLKDIVKDRRKQLEEEIEELMREEDEGDTEAPDHEEVTSHEVKTPEVTSPELTAHEVAAHEVTAHEVTARKVTSQEEEGPLVEESHDKSAEGPEELDESVGQDEAMDQSTGLDQSVDKSNDHQNLVEKSVLQDRSVDKSIGQVASVESPRDDEEVKGDEVEGKVNEGNAVEGGEEPMVKGEDPGEGVNKENLLDGPSEEGLGKEVNGMVKSSPDSPEIGEKSKQIEAKQSDFKSEKRRSSRHRSHEDDDKERKSSYHRSRSHRDSEGDRGVESRRRSHSHRDDEDGRESSRHKSRKEKNHREDKWEERVSGKSTGLDGEKRRVPSDDE